ncbi:MAG: WXG100 family type VII secretion target [Acidimicrobiales bacterium]|nr:WXG100 family type VII secretion target [Acidimicrobiales bacterium]
MTGKLGMNPEEVRQLARQMDDTAGQIEDLMNRVTQKLSGTTWEGNDRRQFESTWQSDSVRQLQQVKQLLTEAANKARTNAQDQESTSNRI